MTELVTIEVEGFGPVTFRPAGKVQMLRVRAAARRGNPRGFEAALREMPPERAQRVREDALLTAWQVTSPKFTTEEETEQAFAGREGLLLEIAEAIRRESWPKRGSG